MDTDSKNARTATRYEMVDSMAINRRHPPVGVGHDETSHHISGPGAPKINSTVSHSLRDEV